MAARTFKTDTNAWNVLAAKEAAKNRARAVDIPAWQKVKEANDATNAARTTVAAAPAEKVKPFNTPEEQQNKIGWDLSNANTIEELKGQVAQANTDATYNATQNETAAKSNQSVNNDNMAARGIIQSSVRDAASYDIEAQRALQSGLIASTLKNITDAAGAKLEAIRVANDAYQKTYGAQGVAHAEQVNSQIVPPDPGPPAAPPPPPAAPPPPPPPAADLIEQWRNRPYREVAGADSKGHKGIWHVYPDGRKVFVAG